MTAPTQQSSFLPAALYKQIHSADSVTAALALSSAESPVSEVATRLYGPHHGHAHHTLHKDEEREHDASSGGVKSLLEKLHLSKSNDEQSAADTDKTPAEQKQVHNPADDQWQAMRLLSSTELEEVKQCGKWGAAQPTELFLQLYAQVLLTLEEKPLNGMVSPSLLGSCGVVPLSIISVIPDIIQHHADVIVRAEKEVFLATNFWEASGAAQTIVDAFKELSRRVVEQKRDKVVVKLMYDRGNPSQMIDPHQSVDSKTYHGDKVKLPLPEEIPGLELQVQNYHVPPVGTFHSKYMVVDRKVTILNSNNIQDRVNVEMMTHIEGPIVQSFYDMALLSWWKSFTPPLPLLNHPPTYPDTPDRSHYSFGQAHPVISTKGDLDSAASKSRQTLAEHHAQTEEPSADQAMRKQVEKWDSSNQDEAERVNDQFSTEASINQHLNTGTKIAATDSEPPQNAEAFKPLVLHSPHDPVPMALVNRAPRGRPGHGDTYVPQDQAWLAAFKFAKKNVFVQTPTFNAVPVVEAALDACRRGILVEIYADLGFNDEGELLPYQGGTNKMVVQSMYGRLAPEHKQYLRWYWYTGKDQKRPLNAKDKSRNCHVKLMIVDGHIGIQGNGNQDTQSWFHSQEINVMLDSEVVCGEWREAIDANQNTRWYGLVDAKDGVWRDKDGNELSEAERGKDYHGPFKSLAGVKGAIQRVRGEGGF